MSSRSQHPHVSVLVAEVLECLAVRPEGFYVDCTAGGGGHSSEIAGRLTTGRLLALDRDETAVELSRARLAEFGDRVVLMHSAFSNLGEVTKKVHEGLADGILADLGMSQMHLDDPGRGFSFAAEGELDMRMDRSQELTAAQVVNHLDETTLADVLYQYADERRSRRIAKAIVRARPLTTARKLADVVAAASRGSRTGRIHPATRTFQALRIYVNNEVGELESLLGQIPAVTRPGARIAIIGFHSLEDRMVKQAFRRWQAEGTCRVLTKHAVQASDQEVANNRRARSARLRCAERI